MKLSKLMEMYIACNPKIESEATETKCMLAIKALSRGLGREAKVGDLNRNAIIAAIRPLDMANSTKNSYLSCIKAMWDWASRTGENVPECTLTRADWFKNRPAKPVAMSADEMARVEMVIDRDHSTLPSGVPAKLFWRALFRLCAKNGGERIGALLQIQKEWVDTDPPRRAGCSTMICVPGEYRKDGEHKTYPLLDSVGGAVRELAAATPRELLFDAGMGYQGLLKRWYNIVQAAGLPADRRYSFHALRRTCYTHLRAAGQDAGKLLGHKTDMSKHYEDPRFTGGVAGFRAAFE